MLLADAFVRQKTRLFAFVSLQHCYNSIMRLFKFAALCFHFVASCVCANFAVCSVVFARRLLGHTSRRVSRKDLRARMYMLTNTWSVFMGDGDLLSTVSAVVCVA